MVEHPEDNGCLMVNAAAEMSKKCEKTAQVVCNTKESLQELFTIWLDDAKEKNVLKLQKSTSAYSPFLYNALCGLKVLSQSGGSRVELENVVNVTLSALV